MSVRADPLRNTLDHLALDPRAKDDRKYLVSMLRRLGYTEAEIKEALGIASEGSRVIELEYRKGPASGAGAFSVVDEPQTVEFVLRADHVEGEAVGFSVAGRSKPVLKVPADEPWDSTAAMDVAVEHGWIPMDGDRSVHGTDIDNPWEGVETGVEATETGWDEGTEEWQETTEEVAWEDEVAFSERTTEEATAWPEDAAPEAAEEWPTEEVAWPDADATEVEAAESWEPVEASGEYQVTDAPGGAWDADEAWAPAAEGGVEQTWVEETTEAAEPEWVAEPGEVEAAEHAVDDMDSFAYGEFNLYTRMVELSTGRQQRIYFFAKSEPKSGTSCALPAGYIVEENLHTGLPFLRRDPTALEATSHDEPAEELDTAHCLATTKAGTQCKNAPLEKGSYCTIHKGRA